MGAGAGRPDVDYSPFQTMTGRHGAGGSPSKTEQWHERVSLIRRSFPSVVALDWSRLPQDEPEVIGAVLKDVLKAMQATPGRPGPRPGLDVEEAQPVVDEWLGRDYKDRPYATLPFPQAFRIVVRPLSIRQVARKLDWSKERVYRLMAGLATPSAAEMEAVADRFGKRPSYFMEYRVGWAVSVFLGVMESEPDRTIRVYEALQQAVG